MFTPPLPDAKDEGSFTILTNPIKQKGKYIKNNRLNNKLQYILMIFYIKSYNFYPIILNRKNIISLLKRI